MVGLTGYLALHGLLTAVATTPSAETMLEAFEAHENAKALKAARSILQNLEARSVPSADLSPSEPDLDLQAKLTEAFSLLRLRRYADARRALDGLAENGPDLGNLVPHLRVQIATAERDCEGAQQLAAELAPSSVYWSTSWSRITFCWLAEKEAANARGAVDRYLEGANDDLRRATGDILRGRIFELEGELGRARDSYRGVTVDHATTSAAVTAKGRLKALKRRGLRSLPLSPQELLAQADAERAQQKLKSAKGLYSEIKKRAAGDLKKMKKKRGKKPDQLRSVYQLAELGLIEIEIVSRGYQRALKRVGKLVQASDREVRARALYLKGDIQARVGSLSHSLRTYNDLLEDAPGHPFALEAALSAANMAYSARYLSKARGFSQWIVENAGARQASPLVGEDGVHRNPNDKGGARDHGLWLMAWNERRSGAVAEVVDSFLAQIDTTGTLGQAAIYWRARLAIDAGDIEAAEVFIEMLSKAAPTSYYALAAHDLLLDETKGGLSFPSLAGASEEITERPAGEARDMLGLMVLTEQGLGSQARELLRSLPVTSLEGPDRVAASWLYRKCGELSIAATLVRRLAMQPEELDFDPVLFQLAYPRPFSDLVAAFAAQYDVPVDLLYAIMRVESGFNPRAQSPRLARGLMQMIRPTARRIAADVELKRFSSRQLFDPEVAIRFGTHHVASLLERFDGNLVAAIAAYHAGEERVARWLRNREQLAADEFIEDIPFSTTRGYVKKVLTSYAAYRLLYGGDQTAAFGPLRLDSFNRKNPPPGGLTAGELARAEAAE